MKKIPVAIIGATGMVGQRFVSLLAHHPWFTIVAVAASKESAGKTYEDAVAHRWALSEQIPASIRALVVLRGEDDLPLIAKDAKIVFSALDMEKDRIVVLEEAYAAAGVMVVSNNSAHRWTSYVPMILPEINSDHLSLITYQRNTLGWKTGGIVVKPNCSLQSFVPVLHALRTFNPRQVTVTTTQAVSGAGKTLETWPEMGDNVIPFIKGEEEKTQSEPLKIWGEIKEGEIKASEVPIISATCLRVPVSDGHLASVSVKFEKSATLAAYREVLLAWRNPLQALQLPSSPKKFLHLFDEQEYPQTKLHRDLEKGMAISIGRLRACPILDLSFVALSHNTLRGAAGGAVLTAELLVAKGYV